MSQSTRYQQYVDLCAQHHATHKTFSGWEARQYIEILAPLARKHECKTIIDYGCGKGLQYKWRFPFEGREATLNEHLGIPEYSVIKYDPAVPEFSAEPQGQADLVLCTDVLEHIPEEDQAWVAKRLFMLTRKLLFVAVDTRPAKKRLPNGENTHVCLKPKEWWEELFQVTKPHPFEIVLLVDK